MSQCRGEAGTNRDSSVIYRLLSRTWSYLPRKPRGSLELPRSIVQLARRHDRVNDRPTQQGLEQQTHRDQT
jgi:hypothetical protein